VLSPILQPLHRDPADHKLTEFAQHALRVTGAAGIAVGLEASGSVVCCARAGDKAPGIGARLHGQSGITGHCVRSGKTIYCDDGQSDPRANAEACRRLGVRSIIAVPLWHEPGIIGVLEAFSQEANAFTNAQRQALEALADTIVAHVREKASDSIHQPPAPFFRVYPKGSAANTAAQCEVCDVRTAMAETAVTLATEPARKSRISIAVVIAWALLSFMALALLYTAKMIGRPQIATPAIATPPATPASPAAESPTSARADNILVAASVGSSAGVPLETPRPEPPKRDNSSLLNALRSSAERGDADAQYKLASALAGGEGIGQDLIQAYAWYIAADVSGDPHNKGALEPLTKKLTAKQIAQVRVTVANMFLTGIGVRQDNVSAYYWLLLAEAAGDRDARAEAANLASNMSEQQIAEATDRAQSWLNAHNAHGTTHTKPH
jgi:GAF domain/Sel1 repeat